MSSPALLQIDLPGIPKLRSGKVREIFDLGDHLLLVASDRISAFDCILPNGIPGKGEVLTQISHFWFDRLSEIIPNHRVHLGDDNFPPKLREWEKKLRSRSMIVKKAEPLPIECVVRGYLAGSGWKEYQEKQTVCGIKLPGGLKESAQLPEPIFTPATKESSGHDQNISFDQAIKMVGREVAERVRTVSLEIYKAAATHAADRGIIVADTKFEFGKWDGKMILIDEVLTPDSSRFWPADGYVAGQSQPSFDKQFVRDYLETLDWNKMPPAPALPEEIVEKTREKYQEAYQRLTEKRQEGASHAKSG